MARPFLLPICLAPFAVLAFAQTQDKISFSREVVPVFKAHCLSCHSGHSPSGDLDLSTEAGIKKGGATGPLFIAGKPDESTLVKRLRGVSGERMPMDLPALSEKEIGTVVAWIKGGAEIDKANTEHWAYKPPVLPAVPNLGSSWVRNPIDSFVLAKLAKEGLKPTPRAARETLIRRVSLDLTGLPPTPDDVDAFVTDKSGDAYEKVVDRLLASPHYGERQARGWLDLARYADSDGYEKDLNRTAWLYRDWVINAFNKDMPYDVFTVKQIAGDLLPASTVDDKVATGFQRNTMFNREGGVNQEEAHFAVVEDRAEVTSSVWLGSTLNCSRCHDHKYDPFTQKDYYGMVAFYNRTAIYPRGPKDVGEEKWFEATLPVPTPEQASEAGRVKADLALAQQQMDAAVKTKFSQWVETTLRSSPTTAMVPTRVASRAGQSAMTSPDGTVLMGGPLPDNDVYTLALPAPGAPVTAIRLDALTDAGLGGNGPGRADNGNFVLTKVKIFEDGREVPLLESQAEYSQDGFPATTVLSGDVNQGWGIGGGNGKPHFIVVRPAAPLTAGHPFSLILEFNSVWKTHVLGKFRVSTLTGGDPFQCFIPPDLVAGQIKGTPDAAGLKKLEDFFRTRSAVTYGPRHRVAEDQAKLAEVKAQEPVALVMEEKSASDAHHEWVRMRGNFGSKGDDVPSGTPKFLGDPVAPGSNRLGLAQWLASKKNPLTARVEVNRLWEQYFGRGLVETCEDFGTRCTPPTHPELLDWLACTFMAKGWDIKAMTRLIVTSATYMQASDATPELAAKDPQNLLLARGPRFRMEAEMIHDNALAISGLLSPKVGGPSVFPYQPPHVWNTPYNDEDWMPSAGQDKYRRGLYTFWKRSAPYPNFATLDATSRESCTVRRIRTNTPLQALALMNDQVMVDASRALAHRMMQGGKDDSARLEAGFRLCMSRRAKPQELKVMAGLLATLRKHYQENPKDAAKFSGVDEASYTLAANVLLNLDETMTKE